MIKIDKNIPLNSGIKFPLDDMEVGDSFEVPAIVSRRAVNGQIQQYYRKHGYKKRFTVRRYNGGLRCWRIE